MSPRKPFMSYRAQAVAVVIAAHTKTDIEGCSCGWAEMGLSHFDHVALMIEQRGLISRVGSRGPEDIRELLVDGWNNFTTMVTGNSTEIDVLKTWLLPNPIVKSIAIYKVGPSDLIERLNHTQIKAKREELGG